MTATMPLAQRLRFASAQVAAVVLVMGASFIANHGVAAAMELAGVACLIVAGVIASNTIVWIVIGIFDILVLILFWMDLRLFLVTKA